MAAPWTEVACDILGKLWGWIWFFKVMMAVCLIKLLEYSWRKLWLLLINNPMILDGCGSLSQLLRASSSCPSLSFVNPTMTLFLGVLLLWLSDPTLCFIAMIDCLDWLILLSHVMRKPVCDQILLSYKSWLASWNYGCNIYRHYTIQVANNVNIKHKMYI